MKCSCSNSQNTKEMSRAMVPIVGQRIHYIILPPLQFMGHMVCVVALPKPDEGIPLYISEAVYFVKYQAYAIVSTLDQCVKTHLKHATLYDVFNITFTPGS